MKKFILTFCFLLSAAAFCGTEEPAAQWRAYALPVDGFTAKLFKQGDIADILFYYDNFLVSGRKEALVATLLQKVRVLDVLKADGDYAVVLQVDPRDAQYLFVCEKSGKLKPIIRNPNDAAVNVLDLASFSTLFK